MWLFIHCLRICGLKKENYKNWIGVQWTNYVETGITKRKQQILKDHCTFHENTSTGYALEYGPAEARVTYKFRTKND